MDAPSYQPREWHDDPAGETPITADALNRVEQGIWEITQMLNDVPVTASAVVATVSPLSLTISGIQVPAARLAGYTPVVGHQVMATRIEGSWVVEDRVVAS